MIYLAPNYHRILPMYREKFGYMASSAGGGWMPGVKAGCKWMLDNDSFSGKFNIERWQDLQIEYLEYRENCIAVVVPDVLRDAKATIEKWHEYKSQVIQGYPRAFVTQNGLTTHMVPWDELDVLFIGGDDEHKLYESMPFILEAQAKGKWVHVGRVNGIRRLERFWMVDSVDGTVLVYPHSPRRQHRIMRAVSFSNSKKRMKQLL
jgi:hypothetical protein